MNKSFHKGLITGIVLTLIFALALTVGAEVYKKNIDVVYRDIKVVVDGKPIQCRNGLGAEVEPFIISSERTTYVPIRAFSEAVGVEVTWVDDTNTIYLGEKPSTGELVSLADLESYAGTGGFRKGWEFTFRQKEIPTQNSMYDTYADYLIRGDYIKFTAKAACPDNKSCGSVKIYDADNIEDGPIFEATYDELVKFGEIIDVEADVIGIDKIRVVADDVVIYDAYLTPIKTK